jgi:hypothetical protein
MKSKRRTPAERKASAVHEAGHALERSLAGPTSWSAGAGIAGSHQGVTQNALTGVT